MSYLDSIVAIVVSLAICVVLPSIITWLILRAKTHKVDRQTEIILAALEKNPDLDVEEFMKKMTPPQKTEAEKLTTMLLRGCILSFLGLAFLGLSVWTYLYGASRQAVAPFAFFFIACLGTGISYLIAYKIRKK